MGSNNGGHRATDSAEERIRKPPKNTNHFTIHCQISVDPIVQPCANCRALADLQGQINSAQGAPHDLVQKLVALNTKRNLDHDRLIRRFPVEIISHIFILVSTIDHCPHIPPKKPPSQMLLSRVCTRWREVALTTTQLWTNVFINLAKHATQLDVTSIWLSRSRSLPLNLTLYRGENYDSFSIDPLVNVLRSHSARWDSLDLKLAPGDVVYKLFNNLKNIPNSTSLHLQLGNWGHPHSITLRTPLEPSHFSSVSFFPRQPDFAEVMPLRWDNLTYLKLINIHVHILIDIVRKAPRLIHWESKNIFRNPEIEVGDSPITFTTPIIHYSLKHLELMLDGPETHLFRHLTLPSLQYLKSDIIALFNGIPEYEEIDDLIDFLSRSKLDLATLQTFDLGYYTPAHANQTQTRFRELKTVTQLSIGIWEASQIVPRIAHPLLISMADVDVFPNLRVLRIILLGTTNQPSVWATLCDFIAELNSNAQPSETSAKAQKSSDVASDSFQKDSSILNFSIAGKIPGCRPLQSITVLVTSSGSIRMKKDVLLRLQEVQRVGPIQLEVRYDAHRGLKDILQSAATDGGNDYVFITHPE